MKRKTKKAVIPILEAGARTGKSTTDIRAGIGIGTEGDPMFTLQATKQHAVCFQANGDRDNPGLSISDKAFTIPANPMSDRGQAVCYDMRGNGDGKTIPCLTGDHASRPTDYTPVILQGLVDPEVFTFAKGHYTRGKSGKPSNIVPTLAADTEQGDMEPLVFESRFARNGRGAPSKIAPPLKAQSGQTGKGDAAPLVFQQNTRCEVRFVGDDKGKPVAGALVSEPGANGQNYVYEPMILDEYNQTGAKKCYPLRTATGDGTPKVELGSSVRRLTPTECERLQGFKDGHTFIPTQRVPAKGQAKARAQMAKGDERFREIDGVIWVVAADGPRYKALGNSMAVPCMRFIGEGIQLLEQGDDISDLL